MLALSRVNGEEFLIGRDIVITVLETGMGIAERGYVRLRVKAPVAPHSTCGTRTREGDCWVIEHTRLERFYIGSNGFQIVRAGNASMKMAFNIPRGVIVSRGENSWLHEKILAGTATADDMEAVKKPKRRVA